MKIKFILLLSSLTISFVYGQEEEDISNDYQLIVSAFINNIKYHRDSLAENVIYPLRREYPLPRIKNKNEFLKRYQEVFDDSIVQLIVNSDPKKDWSQMGWRGIMLFHGTLWLDDDGMLIGVNYQSKAEKEKRNDLIQIDKNNINPSLRNFLEPIHVLETTKYRIRIDKLDDENYRYSSWPLNKKMTDKPDLLLENGKWYPEGSGGNHRYEFKNAGYTYECAIIVLGTDDSPPAQLTVYKSGKEILSQRAIIVEK